MAVLHYIASDGVEYQVESITEELYTLVYQASATDSTTKASLCKLHILGSSSTEAIFLLYSVPKQLLVHFDSNIRTIIAVDSPSKRLQVEHKLSATLPSTTFYACVAYIIQKALLFQFKATYSITVNTRNVAPSTYVTYITTTSTVRIDLQYNNSAVKMDKNWYCRLSVYGTSGKTEKSVYVSNTVTVASTATYCTIPKIDTNTGTASARPIKLYLEYSFDKSSWTSILLHTFPDSSTTAIACTDVTDVQGRNL